MISLRPYQEAALAAIDEAYRAGTRRQAVQLPTGAGKTVVFCSLCEKRGGRSLILAHRDELITQAQAKMRMVAPELGSGIVKAERNETGYPVTIASVQTLSRPSRLAAFPRNFDTVVVDEAHHTAADSYHRVLDHVVGSNTLLLGVSATLERSDRVGLDDIYEAVTYEINMLDLMRRGYLSDVRCLEVGIKINFGAMHKRGGDYIDGELEQALHEANAPAQAVEAYEKHAAGRKALLFAPTVASAQEFRDAFAASGHSTGLVWGAQAPEARHDTLARYSRGEISVLCNCMVLTEGFDEPSVNCVIMARPTTSKPLYIQMLGRGTRTHPGKDDLLVLDLVGAASRMGDLMTGARLFGVEPQIPNNEEREPLGMLEALEVEVEKQTALQIAGELVAREVDLFKRRDLHWGVGDDQLYTLSAGTDGTLVVRPRANGLFEVVRLYRAQGPFDMYPRDYTEVLADGLDVGYAQGMAEDYARRAGAEVLNNANAAWRRRAPSDKALAFAKRMGIKNTEGMNAGKLSDLIDRAKAARLIK